MYFFDIFGTMATTAEAQLADLGFRLIAPAQALRHCIQSYWYFRRDTPLPAYREEYMHPRGGFGLVFNFGESVRLDGQLVVEPLFLDGATTKSRRLGFLGRVELMGIRFQEGGAYPVLGVPLAELRNETQLLDAGDRASLLRLYARLHGAGSLPERLRLLEAWVIQRLSCGKQGSSVVPATLLLLREQAGQLSIPQLARDCGISQRQLERVYQTQVGMSPKQYSQLLRVDQARLALKNRDIPSTAFLAAEHGFYDQSHFIREFSAVVGMTPYAYRKRSRGGSDPAG